MIEVKTATNPRLGKGLFAKKVFKRGDIVCKFTGRVVDPNSVAALKHAGWNVDLGNGKYLNVFHSKCKAKYANDANGDTKIGKRNNGRIDLIKGIPHIVTSSTITPGNEIFISYGQAYWNEYKASIKTKK